MVDKKIVQEAFDNKPLLPFGDFNFLVNPLTEQIPATTAALLQAATEWLVEVGDFQECLECQVGEDQHGGVWV